MAAILQFGTTSARERILFAQYNKMFSYQDVCEFDDCYACNDNGIYPIVDGLPLCMDCFVLSQSTEIDEMVVI